MIMPSDVIEIDSEQAGHQIFVKLNCANHGLLAMVCKGNEQAPKTLDTLTVSQGLKALIQLRNKAQAAAFETESKETFCKLFDTTPAKKARVARRDAQAMREAPQSLEVYVPIDGDERRVAVLRPVHPRDAVYVEYETDTIATVITYIRGAGFDDCLKQSRMKDLPKGIHLRKHGIYKFAVMSKRDDGKKQMKMFKELADAMVFHTDPDSINHSGVAADDVGSESSDGA